MFKCQLFGKITSRGTLLVLTGLLFAYASSVFIEEALDSKALYCAALTNHCVMVVMSFLQRVNHKNDHIKLDICGFDPQIRKPVVKAVLFPLPDILARLV